MQANLFTTENEVKSALAKCDYLPSGEIVRAVFLADRLKKPILIEGPAGTGKTELPQTIAKAKSLKLIRLQCYEGLDESKVIYEWNYKKQLLRIQAQEVIEGKTDTWKKIEEDIFSEDFLLERPLLKAIKSKEQVVLLIDEIDRVEPETEALLLELLSEFQVSVPELGTISSNTTPFVVLTSNNTRELSEALKRRCLYLYLDYPDPLREKAIIMTKVPEIGEVLAKEIVNVVKAIRSLDLKKKPSVSETLDWAKTLVILGVKAIDESVSKDTISVLLKYQVDIEKVLKELQLS